MLNDKEYLGEEIHSDLVMYIKEEVNITTDKSDNTFELYEGNAMSDGIYFEKYNCTINMVLVPPSISDGTKTEIAQYDSVYFIEAMEDRIFDRIKDASIIVGFGFIGLNNENNIKLKVGNKVIAEFDDFNNKSKYDVLYYSKVDVFQYDKNYHIESKILRPFINTSFKIRINIGDMIKENETLLISLCVGDDINLGVSVNIKKSEGRIVIEN